MPKDKVLKIIFFFHTNRPKIFISRCFHTGKWLNFFHTSQDCVGTLWTFCMNIWHLFITLYLATLLVILFGLISWVGKNMHITLRLIFASRQKTKTIQIACARKKRFWTFSWVIIITWKEVSYKITAGNTREPLLFLAETIVLHEFRSLLFRFSSIPLDYTQQVNVSKICKKICANIYYDTVW